MKEFLKKLEAQTGFPARMVGDRLLFDVDPTVLRQAEMNLQLHIGELNRFSHKVAEITDTPSPEELPATVEDQLKMVNGYITEGLPDRVSKNRAAELSGVEDSYRSAMAALKNIGTYRSDHPAHQEHIVFEGEWAVKDTMVLAEESGTYLSGREIKTAEEVVAFIDSYHSLVAKVAGTVPLVRLRDAMPLVMFNNSLRLQPNAEVIVRNEASRQLAEANEERQKEAVKRFAKERAAKLKAEEKRAAEVASAAVVREKAPVKPYPVKEKANG